MFRIVLNKACFRAFLKGDIDRGQLRDIRSALRDKEKCDQLEKLVKQKVLEDEDGRELLKEMFSEDQSNPSETLDSQKLINRDWDWIKLLNLLIKLAPIIIALL